MERAVALTQGDVVPKEALPEEIRDSRTGARGLGEQLARLPFKEAMDLARDRAARDYLEALMKTHEGNVTRAAQSAGVERESLHRLLKRHGLKSEDFKA